MAVVTLVEKVKSLVKLVDNIVVLDEDVVYYLNNGSRFVVHALPQHLGDLFTEYKPDDTGQTGNGIVVYNPSTGVGWTVTHVHRKTKNSLDEDTWQVCKEILDESRYQNDFNTLRKASKVFPIFYRDKGNLFVKPDPAAGEEIKAAVIIPPVILLATENFFEGLENVVVNYAASFALRATIDKSLGDVAKSLSDLVSELSGLPDISTADLALIDAAIENARKLIIDATGMTNTPQDATSMLARTEEDTEMVQGIIATARQELERAITILKKYTDMYGAYASKVSAAANALAAMGQSLQSIYKSADAYYHVALSELQFFITSHVGTVGLPRQEPQPQQKEQ